ncbi:hypothetical protein CYMTET_43489 [Cymbomonas tetramitiformis]|uniref:Uncharacterized protein n=1 Tax=Cymbomonas tetramitiformis TaxID=36881 RepID=A0AAE0F1L4_9CHLO|nr:hypothetical protein CYMTET_43489 [Cymbomonas tetramitiformis]
MPITDAFAVVLSASQVENLLPDPILSPHNGKDKLRNVIIDYLRHDTKTGFSKEQCRYPPTRRARDRSAIPKGLFLVDKLLAAFWPLSAFEARFTDPSLETPGLMPGVFEKVDGSDVEGVEKVAKGMFRFFGFVAETASSKKAKPRLTMDTLVSSRDILLQLVSTTWLAKHARLIIDLKKAEKCLTLHIKRRELKAKEALVEEEDENVDMEGVVSTVKSGTLSDVDGLRAGEDLDGKYGALNTRLSLLDNYDVIFLNDFIPDPSVGLTVYAGRKQRERWVTHLRIWTYSPRNNAVNLMWLWRVPPKAEDRSTQRVIENVDSCRTKIEEKVTSAERGKLRRMLEPLLVSNTSATVNYIFHLIHGGACKAMGPRTAAEKARYDRVEGLLAANGGEPDVLFDCIMDARKEKDIGGTVFQEFSAAPPGVAAPPAVAAPTIAAPPAVAAPTTAAPLGVAAPPAVAAAPTAAPPGAWQLQPPFLRVKSY